MRADRRSAVRTAARHPRGPGPSRGVLRERGAVPVPVAVSLADRRGDGALTAVLPGWITARLLVAGALALSRFLVDELHPAAAGAAARAHQGLLAWDASWYARIAEHGYAPLPDESIRFFPLIPVPTRGPADVTPFHERVALVAPAAGAGVYLGWVQLHFGDWLLPLRIQRRHNLRGSFANPITTLDHATRGLLDGHEVGTGLHVPWAVLLAVGVVISLRRWPLSYGAFAAAMLAAGISSSNLDSLERYALSAFPFVLVAAGLLRREWLERGVLVLSGGAMV